MVPYDILSLISNTYSITFSFLPNVFLASDFATHHMLFRVMFIASIIHLMMQCIVKRSESPNTRSV
jgi:hypothetical protein